MPGTTAMNLSVQRQIVLISSLSLTALLAGALGGAAMVSRTTSEQLRDPKFLSQRLKELEPAEGPVRESTSALVRVAVAQNKPAQPVRPIIGRLVEVRHTTASSEVNGKLIQLPVEEGTEVVGGQTVLAEVDNTWCQLALDALLAQQESTDAELRFEREELQRIEGLRSRGASTESEQQQRLSAVEILQARLKEIEVRMQEQSEKQQRARILAPFDGTVVRKLAELGEYVTPGSPIVEIVSRGEIDALLMVPESVVNFIRVEQVLAIQIDPLGEEVTGSVVSVTPLGSSASRTFPVRIRLDDQDGRLKAGMSVTAMIATGSERQALVVPKDAVLVRPDGATVWAVQAEQGTAGPVVQAVPVEIDVRMEHDYAVLPETAAGRQLLGPGTQVVIEGGERLTPGQAVTIVTLPGA
jgi:RND family efflux transporter MFP subunit